MYTREILLSANIGCVNSYPPSITTSPSPQSAEEENIERIPKLVVALSPCTKEF